jgi:glycosyltransferase involved in cell wall biosynthesis
VIIAASGRDSLRSTLRRIQREDEGDVEALVVSDGHQPLSEAIVRKVARQWSGIRYVEGPQTRRWGNAQKMEGIRRARGRYLLFMDDDDHYRRGAFKHIRAAASANPERITLFRIKWRGEILWRHPSVEVTNVATPQVLVPNRTGKVGSWLTNDHYWSDFDFISECVALQGEPVWDPAIIATVDPFRWSNFTRWLIPRMRLVRRRLALRTRIQRRRLS